MTTSRRDLATIDAELAAEAAKISQQVGQPEARKITIDVNGNFIAPGGLNLGNEIQVCVVDFCSANDYYTAAYDPNNPAPPVCFARGRELADMQPEESSPEPQSDNCKDCPHNQWGSRGNGKACKNTRSLAVVLMDEFNPEDIENAEMYLLAVPPTGLKSFDAAALQASRMFNGPPIKAIMTVRAVKQANYTTMQFASPEANPHYADMLELRDDAFDLISRLPDLSNYKPTPQRRPTQPRGR